MGHTFKGVELVAAADYTQRVASSRACVVLLLAAQPEQMRLIGELQVLSGRVPYFVVPLTDEEAHLVAAIRVPRLRHFAEGRLLHDKMIDLDQPETVNKALHEMGLI